MANPNSKKLGAVYDGKYYQTVQQPTNGLDHSGPVPIILRPVRSAGFSPSPRGADSG
jgi:hypothetical protein